MANEVERVCDHERVGRERERGRGGGVKCETRVVGREVLGEEVLARVPICAVG